MSKPVEIEWITTVEAKKLLGVTSTQGVLNIVRGEKKPYKWIVRYLNIGTDEQPRYMLNRADVEKIAKDRQS